MLALLDITPEIEVEIAHQSAVFLAKYYAAKKDILNWGRILFPEKFTLPFCKEMHEYFVSIRGHVATNVEAPRGHAKTTVKCFLIPIFQALEEPEEFQHYLNVQATDAKALAVNRSIKLELEENEDLRRIYGNQMGERWTDQQFVLRNGVIFTAVSAGQSIRGINYRNARPDYIILDDLYNTEEDINNPDSTIKKNEWFWGSLYPCRAKGKRCSIHIQGTAVNEEDLLEMLKKNGEWESKTFRALKDSGDVLWPELNSRESLEVDRVNMGSIIFERELQNIRRDDATSIIKRRWLQFYDPTDLHRRLMAYDKHFFLKSVKLCVDPSAKEKEENDFTGVALILETGYDDSDVSEFWIENVWNLKLSLDGRVMLLDSIGKARARELAITDCRIESIGGFHDFTSEVIRRTGLPVTEIERVKDKITNRENKSKHFENKRVWINKSMDPVLLDILIHQLTNNHPRYDDVCDAVLLSIDDVGAGWGFVNRL